MNYKVNLAALDSSFKVPNALADNFIKLANPKHLVVLLWVLRYAETPKSAEEISKQLHIDKAIVNEAIFYWIDNGFIVPDAAADCVPSEPLPEAPSATVKTAAPSPAKKALTASAASDEDVLQRAKESTEFKYLLQKSQQIYGRTISKAERAMLLSLMDYYALPAEVLLMLIQYAVSSGRTGTNYIQTVGINWAEEGITTLEQAEGKIKQLNKTNKLWHNFVQQAGITHKNPTKKQEALFVKWTKEWKFSVELLAYAYERMLDAIDKVNYTYLDKMLTAWHEAGYKSIAQVENGDTLRRQNKAKAAADPSFSVDKFNNYLDNYKLKYNKEGS